MNNQHHELWTTVIDSKPAEAGGMLNMAMRHTAHSLSDMVNRPFKSNPPRVETIPLNQLALQTEDLEAETVGVRLLLGDGLPGQAILILSVDDAMYLADWLLEERPGTTTKLNSMVFSALAETGNLVLASFLNALAECTGTPLRLSSPYVIADMLATILEAAITPVAAMADEVTIVKTEFMNVESSVLIQFWVLPGPDALA